jgi:hypothetical protein
MPAISAFDALVYSPMLARTPSDLSPLVAPPYDVLDAAGKARLLWTCRTFLRRNWGRPRHTPAPRRRSHHGDETARSHAPVGP